MRLDPDGSGPAVSLAGVAVTLFVASMLLGVWVGASDASRQHAKTPDAPVKERPAQVGDTASR